MISTIHKKSESYFLSNKDATSDVGFLILKFMSLISSLIFLFGKGLKITQSGAKHCYLICCIWRLGI